jgi:O-antigen/teichoic acid export membrane protein
MSKNIFKNALINSILTVVYIGLIASFLFYGKGVFGEGEGGDETVLVPIMMLLLFVISAAITGFLVFGRPVLWYLDGKKKEALSLIAYTIGLLVLIALCVIFVLLI